MGRAYEVRKASIQKTGAAKAKLYSTFAKEIYLVAKGNPEVDTNVNLKRIIEKAKKQQVPSDIINRAIDKAKGNGNDNYEEVTYEGFGPGASTLIIKTLTDNVNRTVGEVRAAFNKVNKSLGVTNSVSYNYDYVGGGAGEGTTANRCVDVGSFFGCGGNTRRASCGDNCNYVYWGARHGEKKSYS